jgi:hypothetical protein
MAGRSSKGRSSPASGHSSNNLQEPEKFAQIWHMLMKGSIISAAEGNRRAAREAKYAAQLILKGWKRTREADKPRAKHGPGQQRSSFLGLLDERS